MTPTQRWWLYVIALIGFAAGLLAAIVTGHTELVPVLIAAMVPPALAAANVNKAA